MIPLFAVAHPTMKNITVSVPDDIYLEARVWAARNNTSVSALVRDFLTGLPELPPAQMGFGEVGADNFAYPPLPPPLL